MRKIVLILSIVFSLLNANGLYNKFETNIIKISDNNAIIKNSKDIVIGSTGVVIHKFDEATSSIVANVKVIKKSGKYAILRIKNYKSLESDALPTSGVEPQVGDRVIINYLYDRALVVAPNYQVYNKIINKYKNIDWINPDIPASFLAKMYRPDPDKKLFQKMCAQNTASLVLFALDDGLYFVDCNNFLVLKKDKAFAFKNPQLPFYSRVKKIESMLFDVSSSELSSYSNYYRLLIKRGGRADRREISSFLKKSNSDKDLLNLESNNETKSKKQ